MHIIARAADMLKAVEGFAEKAKRFFYSVMLLALRCPKCNGILVMWAEGKCRCASCGTEIDPTIAFQRCSDCGGTPILRVRRYQCSKCGREVLSRFLFDGLVFDTEYFREKMAESRQHRKEQEERVRKMLAECRSADLSFGPLDLAAVPGLTEALTALTAGLGDHLEVEPRSQFDLKLYETHIQAHTQNFPLMLEEIPPLSREDVRKDLIWRFIAVIFLAHAGVIDVWQDGQDVVVKKHETNREGQDVSGEPAAVDGS
jgi:DNA-directed RNA polymerase subunit RPC12/RpoP